MIGIALLVIFIESSKLQSNNAMKPIPCILVCFTSWGSICLRKEMPSMRKAKEEGEFMIDEGYAFDYKIRKIKKKS